MRTRTSPKGQEILWRELGGSKPGKAPVKPMETPEAAVERIQRDLVGPIFDRGRRRSLERELAHAQARLVVKKVLAEEVRDHAEDDAGEARRDPA